MDEKLQRDLDVSEYPYRSFSMLKHWLKLMRYQNILMIIATQSLIKYGIFESFGIAVALSTFDFLLLCLSTVFIAAGGNIINDIYDLETDRINKPEKQLIKSKISLKQAEVAYIFLTATGVGIGFYISNLIGKPEFSAVFIIIAALLYLYASYLKQFMIIGNIIISSLVAMVIIIVGLFDLMPAITETNRQSQSVIFSILLDYAWFAFLINWLREIVKDQEDITGDYNTGRTSLPIVIGTERTNKIIFGLGLIPLASVIFYSYEYLYGNLYALLYAMFFIVAPLLYFLISIWNAKTKKEFSKISGLLKLIMVLGLLSLGLYPLILL